MHNRSATEIVAALLSPSSASTGFSNSLRAKRINIARLYGQYRATRKLAKLATDYRGSSSLVAREARIAAQDAWNSLQIMKALIRLDD